MTVNTATPTDEVDTSTNEETPDPEAELESAEDNFDSESDDSEDTEETDDSDADEPASDSEDTDDLEESDEDEPDKEQPKETPADTEAERKRHNDEMAKKRIADREAREKAKHESQANWLDDGYQQAYDKAIKEGKDERDARYDASQALALRQVQVDAYNNRIQANTDRLRNNIDKAVATIDLFQKGTPAVKEKLAKALDYFEGMHVVRDKNGDPVEVTGDLYEFLRNEAEDIRQLLGEGAVQQQRSKKNAKSRTLPKPNRAPRKSEDPMMDGFDEEADRW